MRSEILPVIDDPSLAGQLHWTVVKLTGWLRKDKGVDLSCRTLVLYLHELNFGNRSNEIYHGIPVVAHQT